MRTLGAETVAASARYGGDVVAGGGGLADELLAGSSGCAEYGEFHGGVP